MLKLISGSYDAGCGITLYDTETDKIYHPVVLKDRNGDLFFEINQRYYEWDKGSPNFVLRQNQVPPRLHPMHCSTSGILNTSLSQADRSELFGALIDIVEDWLEEKGIGPEQIENKERDNDNPAIIYGSDYDALADKFSAVLGIDRYGNSTKNMVDLNNYVAYKLWSKEDIEEVLERKGYSPTPKRIADVINSGLLKGLNYADDNEWEIISQAIDDVMGNKEVELD